jgi:hypothetical protein
MQILNFDFYTYLLNTLNYKNEDYIGKSKHEKLHYALLEENDNNIKFSVKFVNIQLKKVSVKSSGFIINVDKKTKEASIVNLSKKGKCDENRILFYFLEPFYTLFNNEEDIDEFEGIYF